MLHSHIGELRQTSINVERFGDEEPDPYEGGSVFDREDSVPLHIHVGIKPEALPLFSLLRKESTFEWTSEYEVAFQNFKEHLSSLSILHKSEPGLPLYLYLLVNDVALASALVGEDG